MWCWDWMTALKTWRTIRLPSNSHPSGKWSVRIPSCPHSIRFPPKPQPPRQIIATDGLWEFVSDQDAVQIAARAPDPQQAVDALIREANRRWLAEEQVRSLLVEVECAD